MQQIDRKRFFDSYRASFGALRQSQVDGLEEILTSLESDARVTDLRHAAYMLATVKHECGDEWRPVRENGRGAGMLYGKPDRVTGQTYYGRGYVQLTWRDNYEALGRILGLDLLCQPDLALNPAHAYRVMSYGMRHGTFTGVGLSRYIHGDVCDYRNARRIINGTDCAERIAGYAAQLEAALRAAA